jgi:hypothetical protein
VVISKNTITPGMPEPRVELLRSSFFQNLEFPHPNNIQFFMLSYCVIFSNRA